MTEAGEDSVIQAPIGTRGAITGVAYNGSIWVATCLTSGGNQTDSLLWSPDGLDWSNAVSGGFTNGGRSVAWNGSLWVAVGVGGAQPINTILTSTDGSNWNNSVSGGFTGTNPSGGFGVVWTGCNWVATGDGGFGTGSYSFLTSPDGSNWTPSVGYGFLDPKGWGTAIAWNGRRLVAVGTEGLIPQTIQYSDDYGATWTVASGTLFEGAGDQGTCVAWNGSYWLAGSLQGFRKSYDGITWFQPLTAPGVYITSLSWTSNAVPTMAIGSSTLQTLSPGIEVYDQLQFINNPYLEFETRGPTPYIGYTSSILTVNSLKINQSNNIGTLPFSTLFTSSFVQEGTTLVSGFLSTTAVFYQGGFYLDIQNV